MSELKSTTSSIGSNMALIAPLGNASMSSAGKKSGESLAITALARSVYLLSQVV